MRYGLAGFAALRPWLPVPVTPMIVRAFKLVADLLAPFGSGRGGMSVMVIVAQERRFWRLLAEEGDGPFILAIATRALLRRATLPVGALPALEAITLGEAEAATSDLEVSTERLSEPVVPLIARLLGPDFEALPEAIRISHLTVDVSHWRGRASARRGTRLWSSFLARLFGFPAEGEDALVPQALYKIVACNDADGPGAVGFVLEQGDLLVTLAQEAVDPGAFSMRQRGIAAIGAELDLDLGGIVRAGSNDCPGRTRADALCLE